MSVYNSGVSDFMAITQFRSKKKSTGGLYREIRKKKKRDFGNDFIPIKIGERSTKEVRVLGGKRKQVLLQIDKANIFDSTGVAKVSKILSVKENMSNPNFVRMNIITKGAVIETELGLARVISRPGQDGVVNAVKIEKK
jgi:small subunit ribosomal protein S8e